MSSAMLMQRSPFDSIETWRPADRLLAQWVRAHGGSDALARWAGACSAAEGEGHTALRVDDAERFGVDPATRDALQDPAWVGRGEQRTPFVLDGEERLCLWRYWQAEGRVGRAIAAMANSPAVSNPVHSADSAQAVAAPDAALIDALFDGPGDGRDAEQREAVRRCGEARLFVLTGGPGTGKTTTVLRMLMARQAGLPRPLKVRVAAPTGKAAQRLVDALRSGSARMMDRAAEGLAAHFLAPEASTVHRLLAYRPHDNRYGRDADAPIDADLVVVDEASMLDLEALDALLAALPASASLWLVGDADQLSPVGPGSAFQDIVQALDHQADAPLVRLRHSFRADAALGAVNAALQRGDPQALDAWREPDAEALRRAQRDWIAALISESPLTRLPADPRAASEAAAAALAQLGRRQWLCATRDGERGSVAVNRRFDAALRAASRQQHPRLDSLDEAAQNFPGRRIMILRNAPQTGLFNGDVGLCLADADGRLRAWFEGSKGPRALSLGALPEHDAAYALTVHKSQGSEYEAVAVLLPDDDAHRLLSRELIYTAASRARRALQVFASAEVIAAAVSKAVQRMGGLHVRLAEALDERS